MSFSSETKAELCREKMSHLECAQAEAYGVLLFCNVFTPWEVRITTQSLEFAQRLPKLFHRSFGLAFDQTPAEETRGKQTFLCTDREKIARMLDTFGYSAETAVFQHINYAVLEEPATKAAFLRGAFLSGGSVTDPKKRYHLEIATTHYYVHRELQALLPELALRAKETTRKSNYVTYFKQSEIIADVLTTIGAPVAAMEVMNAKVEKNLMNGVNRRLNCDVANVDKAVQAAQSQIEAIRRLERRGELARLPDKLQETAALRLEHPELSLSQLAELCSPPVTKSCLNHRLRKLLELGKENAE
ncbi:MAG: DNA-binding protein WhiA [Candidatus Onthomonas sp.]|nr:DNA-binding protein WhiA [Candidatus Onthomonas sp.]